MNKLGKRLFGFLFGTASDFVKIFTPFFSKKGKGFAFIVHPRGYGDIIGNLPFLKIFPRKLVLKLFPLLWPFTVSKIYGLKSLQDGKELQGWVIGIPMMPHHMMENRQLVRKKISQAIKLAQKKGAKVVGLGALTGSVTEGGAGLSKSGEVLVTAGRAYTTFVITSYVEDVINNFGLRRELIEIAIVGAAGGVGTAVVQNLVTKHFKKLTLIDLERKLDRIKEAITPIENNTEVEITHQIGSVRNADIIITVTNAPEAVVDSDDIKPGAIIIDDAQPSDISPEVLNRNDVIVIEAGVITAGSIHVGTNFRLANKGETYCCLGEVMCLAASGWEGEYKAGKITPEVIEQLSSIGKDLGFLLAPYQSFGKVVKESKIDNVRKIVSKQVVIQ